VRRRAFDSVDPLFDDTVPAVLAKDKAEADFFAAFGPVFDRNARWSNKTPVPLLGMPASKLCRSREGGGGGVPVHDRSESVFSFFIQCGSESKSGPDFPVAPMKIFHGVKINVLSGGQDASPAVVCPSLRFTKQFGMF
jgi:hypothetical protein